MKRIVVLTMVSLIVLSLPVFARPGSETAPEASAASGEPQYGGTITLWGHDFQRTEPPNPSIASGNYPALWWLDFIQEKPLMGDAETYGPRGTGEYLFQTYFGIPDQYLTGHLVEDWEVTHEKIIFKVRRGIMWQKVPGVMDTPRELTAQDLAADITRFWKSVWSSRFDGVIKDVYAEGNTVVVEIENFTHALIYYIGYEDRALVSPPETEAAGADKWENQVGTGPYMFDEYVVGSHMSYKRNPDYWDTTIVDGKTYKLPFSDKVRLPIIPDESTRIAALKTGRIDLYRTVPLAHWDILDQQATNMEKVVFSRGQGQTAMLKFDEAPGNNPKVRQAMAMATDRSEFAKLLRSEEMPAHFFPFNSGHPAYTPLEKLPKEMQERFEYNPEKAKKLLAEAGYPNGFTIDFPVATTLEAQDRAALLKDQWAKVGVNIELKIFDATAYVAEVYPLPKPKYSGAILDNTAPEPVIYLAQHWAAGGSGGSANRGAYSNPKFDAVLDKIMLELDVDKRTELLKEAGMILLQDNPSIPLAQEVNRTYWWPWIRNYYGESSVTDDAAWSPLIMTAWVDEGLKKSMGY